MRFILLLPILALCLGACSLLPDATDPTAIVTPTLPPNAEVTATLPTASPVNSLSSPATLAPLEATFTVPPATAVETPAPPQTTETAARLATALELVDIVPPLRDDVRLAIAYEGANPLAATLEPPIEMQPGDTETFFIGNVDSNTVSSIEAELLSVGESAYYWFDQGDGAIQPEPEELAEITAAFDQIYSTLFEYFGQSEPLGGRVHVVVASPEALCDDAGNCRLAGYFSSRDMLPVSINPQSNERSMFVVNSQQFGGNTYLEVLAHELRHLLGNDYESGEEDWFVEGGAMLAEELAGFPSIPQARGTMFLENPDQQLNHWTDGNTIPHYGQGYLVNRFLYDRLGGELYREFIINEAPGLTAVDAVAEANGLAVTGEGFWLDWLAAMALRDSPGVPEQYQWLGPELGPVSTTPVNNLPARIDTTVNQYAADYYELPSSGEVTVNFAGSPAVALFGEPAASGKSAWYAQRANESNPRLTRPLDLREATEATLEYDVFTDIEHGYDFAYVSVSADNGVTWNELVADGMQGLAVEDDPSDVALTQRFYTGGQGEWQHESIDLDPWVGQQILLRFEYVTDPILTYRGFALDNIAISELGFYDDAETLAEGWTAEGFTRATTELPQQWWLQLLTFDSEGRPSVEQLAVPEDGRLQHTYQAFPGVRRPILVVAAAAPESIQPAEYQLDIQSQ